MGKGSRNRKNRKLEEKAIMDSLDTSIGHKVMKKLIAPSAVELAENELAMILFVLEKVFGFRMPRLLKFIRIYKIVADKLKEYYAPNEDVDSDTHVFFAAEYFKNKYHMTMAEMIEKAESMPVEDIKIA